jgi:hypothetical protein
VSMLIVVEHAALIHGAKIFGTAGLFNPLFRLRRTRTGKLSGPPWVSPRPTPGQVRATLLTATIG